MSNPKVTAEIVFLAPNEGGRKTGVQTGYLPHIVVQSRSIRRATVDARGKGNEDYLGVRFLECPSNYEPGFPGAFRLELMYFPNVDYSAVVPGAEFTMREGARIIGHGRIQSRDDLIGE